MKLSSFVSVFEGGMEITIEKGEKTYCEQERFVYDLTAKKPPKGVEPPIIKNIKYEPWWNEIKNNEVENIFCREYISKPDLVIQLKE